MKNLVVFSGAGISAESGIRTFRGPEGLWDTYDVEEIASVKAWQKTPQKVLQFHNERRKEVMLAQPNAAHLAIQQLEECFSVSVITQNIDDLHERAGSKNVIHLHGELNMARSTISPERRYKIDGWQLNQGDYCEEGSQLRPDVVWFGEEVPQYDQVLDIVRNASTLIIVGTSLHVYPAANLIHLVPESAQKFMIDHEIRKAPRLKYLKMIRKKATQGVPPLAEELLTNYRKLFA